MIQPASVSFRYPFVSFFPACCAIRRRKWKPFSQISPTLSLSLSFTVTAPHTLHPFPPPYSPSTQTQALSLHLHPPLPKPCPQHLPRQLPRPPLHPLFLRLDPHPLYTPHTLKLATPHIPPASRAHPRVSRRGAQVPPPVVPDEQAGYVRDTIAFERGVGGECCDLE